MARMKTVTKIDTVLVLVVPNETTTIVKRIVETVATEAAEVTETKETMIAVGESLTARMKTVTKIEIVLVLVVPNETTTTVKRIVEIAATEVGEATETKETMIGVGE